LRTDDAVELPVSTLDFAHLHVHTEYSMLDGLSRVDELVHQAKDYGMSALAITDHGSMFGALDFYSSCKYAGINPIIGVEAYVAAGDMTGRGSQERHYNHLVLLARDAEGYRNLMQLVSKAHLEGYYYKPRIDHALLEKHHEGLIALSGCLSGEVAVAILNDDMAKAREVAGWYRDIMGAGNYYIEIQEHGLEEDARVTAGLTKLARDMGLPLVCTNDSHYTSRAHADAQDLLLAIQMNTTLEDPKRMRMQPNAFYLKSAQEMAELFKEFPDAVKNTLEIASQVHLDLQFDRLQFPELGHVIPSEHDADSYLAHVCRTRLPDKYPNGRQAAEERLEYELSVIRATGFSAYMLFVWDFVRWAREHDIVCGPRGSAAGSIVLYLLGISDVEPLEFSLTFERFLNPERIQMPDIDMDFADDRREEVIQYVVERYGRDHVSQIVTFGRLLARAAIRDAGRAMGYQLSEIDRVTKMIPQIPVGLKIDDALRMNREFSQLYDTDPRVKVLVDRAKSIEGVTRHASTHAAGVVVSRDPLTDHVPLARVAKSEQMVMTQYHMKGLEKIGLLKMDFLGLANLTMLEKAIHNVEESRGIKIDLGTMPLDDQKTYDMLARGETNSVFQLEGRGMTRYIQELKPQSIKHLAAMISLYRPGPMAHIPSYIARKDGREKVHYLDDSLIPLLEETYGIIVYQDQVLQIVQKVAGYSLGQADILRRAMGKKIAEEMKREQDHFVAGALQQGYKNDVAEKLWEYIEPFAGYAFNKAHAVCYAYTSYQTAYFKANYPVEWMAAVLTTEALDTTKVVSVIGECRRLGVPLLPPSVNHSKPRFSVESLGRRGGVAATDPSSDPELGIRYGLAAVKNVGEGAVELLIEEREANGPFQSLEELCRRVDLRTMNKRVIEALIKCGAMDEFGERAQLLAAVDQCIVAGQRDQKAMGAGQTSLFDMADSASAPSMAVSLPNIAPATIDQRLAWEKESLGLYFSEHPFEQAARWLSSRVSVDTSQVTPEIAGEMVTVAGIVTEARRIITKRNETMARVVVEDLHGSVEVIAFPKTYERTAEAWQEDAVVILQGKVDVRDEQVQILCETAERWTIPEGEEPPPPLYSQEVAPTRSDGNGLTGANGSRTSGTQGKRGANGMNAQNGHIPPAAATDDRPPVSMKLTLRRTGDSPADIRTLEKLHTLLKSTDGHDPYELELVSPQKRVRLQVPDARTCFSADLEIALRRLLGPENVVVQAAMIPMPEEPVASEVADLEAPPFPDPILDYEPDYDDVEPYYPASPAPSTTPTPVKPAAVADPEDALVAARISGNLLPGESPLPGIEARRGWWSNED
jgi:DNA polymerase III subunit alpha